MRRDHRYRLLVLLLTVLACAGCVRRRMTIQTNPPGGVAFVDKHKIGLTPTSVPFTYYGTREIEVVKDGHETVTVKQPMPTPWYQVPPIDFFVENLWPFEIRDERIVQLDLPRQRIVPSEEVVQRAEALRANARQGVATPLPYSATGISDSAPVAPAAR